MRIFLKPEAFAEPCALVGLVVVHPVASYKNLGAFAEAYHLASCRDAFEPELAAVAVVSWFLLLFVFSFAVFVFWPLAALQAKKEKVKV